MSDSTSESVLNDTEILFKRLRRKSLESHEENLFTPKLVLKYPYKSDIDYYV
jgi:hypothetical protein